MPNPLTLMRETPSSVMYADLRSFGGISNKDAALILLSAQLIAGGKTARDRVESRTYLSREIVHVRPQDVNPSLYADFSGSVQTLSSRIKAHLGPGCEMAMVSHYAGDAARQMQVALSTHGLDTQVYANECARLQHATLRNERDRSLLLLMLFCVTGCLANPIRAASLVEEFAHHKLAQDLATVTASPDGEEPAASQLGLLRIVGGVAEPPLVPLHPEGSIIGTLAQGEGAITNVGPDVSRAHARIWLENGRWLICGLKSTNGTTLVSGADKTAIVVEPPRTRRTSNIDYPPQEIAEGDMLCLAKDTRFLVLRVRAQG